jgi:bacillithiol biosynthesis deacetylase BshB1
MRVMAIGIHPDDVEINCGGTVALLAARGDEVTVVDLTRGEASTNGTPEERAREAEQATAILGAARRVNASLPDTGVRSDDGEQRRTLVAIVRAHRPHVVLVPHADDPHPDHAQGGTLARHAIFLANVDGYLTSGGGSRQARWRVARTLVYSGRKEVWPDLVVDVTAVYEKKRAAILAHTSQVGSSGLATPLTDPNFLSAVEARDRVAGRRIQATFGEAFELVAPIALGGFDALVGEV